MPKKPPIVALLTDFGVRDHYVGVMKGVLLSICPNLQIIDLSHEVAPHRVEDASYLLWASSLYLPLGAIVLVVVDPEVGTSRRILLARTKRHLYIAPDNGVLDLALWEEKPRDLIALDQGSRFVESIIPQKRSATFHGRDILAPVAAHIARGTPLNRFGKKIKLNVGVAPFISGMESTVEPRILHIDHFGNIVTNVLLPHDEQEPFVKGVAIGKRQVRRWIRTYEEAPPDTPCLIVGSSGLMEIVAKKRDAASMLGVSRGTVLKLIVEGKPWHR